MNSQNNKDAGINEENTGTETKNFDDIYSSSNKLSPQTEENLSDNGGKSEVAKRSIHDDIDDYKFVRSSSHSHHHHHHHHHHHSSSKDNSDDTLLVQSERPAKGTSHKKKRKSSTGNEKYLQEYDELVKSDHPAIGSKEQKKAIKHKHKVIKKKKRRFRTWQRVILTIVSTLLALVLIVTGLIAWFIYNGSKEMLDNSNIISAPSNVVVQNGGQYVVYNGQTYEFNKNMTSLLCIGVDKETLDGASEIKGENGQADVMILVAIDTSSGETKMINISRDTMTDVAVYSASGYYVETVKEQLCLAYAYGDGKESSCANTVTAVERLFYNIPINSYFALDLEGISALNDAVGGIDVVSPETIGDFKEGESYHLMGKDAENFVRSRDWESLDANSKRMQRQQVYIDSFINTVLAQTKKDITTPVNLFNASAPYSCTNLNPSKICYLSQNMLSHNGMNITTTSVPGELKKGETYTEFYVNEDEFYKLILDTYYKPI